MPTEDSEVAAIDHLIRTRAGELMELGGVAGLGRGETADGGLPCLQVFLTERTPELEARLARELEGVRYELFDTDPFRPLD